MSELARPPPTRIEVSYPRHRGKIGLRGSHAPLSWEHTEPPTEAHGDHDVFLVQQDAGDTLEVKLVRDDQDWAGGRNYVIHAGERLVLEPYFDHDGGELLPRATLPDDPSISFEVFLPPSYVEQESKRYPVLYCQDGQSLWTTSDDSFGVWRLDDVLNNLYNLGALDEIIVVGIHTSERRMEKLTPVPDAEEGGGGEAPSYLQVICDRLIPYINKTYRTRVEREHTALLGSSLGGLFSFFAAWTRSDLFGKAACLSSSFWWADRHMVRRVQKEPVPSPRPWLYLDSGAAFNPLEGDANLRDGFHHTRSMFRALTVRDYIAGKDLHRLVFTGDSHDAPSWSQRVAVPLQLLFPPNS